MNEDRLRMMTWKGCYNCKRFNGEWSICNEVDKELDCKEVRDNGSPDWCPYPIINPGETYTFKEER